MQVIPTDATLGAIVRDVSNLGRFSAVPASPVRASPCVGQHSREVLAEELDIGDAEYESPVAAGITGTLDD